MFREVVILMILSPLIASYRYLRLKGRFWGRIDMLIGPRVPKIDQVDEMCRNGQNMTESIIDVESPKYDCPAMVSSVYI